MANIINITEENNILTFDSTPLDIVCGNTNYLVKFSFSEEWQEFVSKLAVFVVDGVKTTVEFEGDECVVPALPNSNCCLLYLLAGDENGNSRVSTALRLRLIPSNDGAIESDFEGFKNYLSLALEKLKQFEQGNYVAKTAEESLTQVDLSSDQTVSGSKDFVGELKYEGEVVAKKSQFSNENLLINGDLSINQRGDTSYTGSTGVYVYSVDRWRIYGRGSNINTTTRLVILYKDSTFTQVVELPKNLLGKTVTATFNISKLKNNISASITDGVNTSTLPLVLGENVLSFVIDEAATTLEVGFVCTSTNGYFVADYVKLEVGEYSTGYHFKSEQDELRDCQRYFYRKNSSMSEGYFGSGAVRTKEETRVVVPLPVEMRTSPTLLYSGDFAIQHSVAETPTSIAIYSFEKNSVTLSAAVTATVQGMGACLRANSDGAYLDFDAEIY